MLRTLAVVLFTILMVATGCSKNKTDGTTAEGMGFGGSRGRLKATITRGNPQVSTSTTVFVPKYDSSRSTAYIYWEDHSDPGIMSGFMPRSGYMFTGFNGEPETIQGGFTLGDAKGRGPWNGQVDLEAVVKPKDWSPPR